MVQYYRPTVINLVKRLFERRKVIKAFHTVCERLRLIVLDHPKPYSRTSYYVGFSPYM